MSSVSAAVATDLRFRWPGTRADCLRLPSLRIERSACVFIHGPSGSGKSTLLSLLAGVLRPTAGDLQVLGHDFARLKPAALDRLRADHVGYLFQQFNLLPYLSAIDNVMLPLRLSAARHHNAERAGGGLPHARALLASMGLGPDRWPRRAAELSVGQQQRVAAARALVGRPELVIADEPTSALDSGRRDEFMDLLLAACREAASTLVFVSHDLSLAHRFDVVLDLPTLNEAKSDADKVPA